jgi:hypothetical protein
MKTWQAVLAHLAVTGCQMLIAVPLMTGTNPTSVFANSAVQIGAQAGLSALQAWVAQRNSKTDPAGQPLKEAVDGTFTSQK